jgi:hypothetical protein
LALAIQNNTKYHKKYSKIKLLLHNILFVV